MRPGGGFELKLDSGERFAARAVVVAISLSGLAHLPPELAGVAPDGPTPASCAELSARGVSGAGKAMAGAGRRRGRGAVISLTLTGGRCRVPLTPRTAARTGAG